MTGLSGIERQCRHHSEIVSLNDAHVIVTGLNVIQRALNVAESRKDFDTLMLSV